MSENTKAELERAKRDEIEMMLPFYVTGQLDQAEAQVSFRAQKLE